MHPTVLISSSKLHLGQLYAMGANLSSWTHFHMTSGCYHAPNSWAHRDFAFQGFSHRMTTIFQYSILQNAPIQIDGQICYASNDRDCFLENPSHQSRIGCLPFSLGPPPMWPRAVTTGPTPGCFTISRFGNLHLAPC